MNRILRYFVVVFFIVAVVAAAYSFYTNKKNAAILSKELENTIPYQKFYDALLTARTAELVSEGTVLKPDILLVDEKGDTVALGELNDSIDVFFCYYRTHCSSCIDRHLTFISENLKKASLKVAILSDFSSAKDMSVVKSLNGLICPVYKMDVRLGIPADSLELPYFFSVESGRDGLCARNVFVPMLEAPSLPEVFLGTLNCRK